MCLVAIPGQSALLPPSPTASGAGVSKLGQEQAQEQESGMNFGPPKSLVLPLMSTIQAVDAAWADAMALPASDRYFVRYLWCADGDFKSANLALNVVSRGVVPVRAVPLAGGTLLRVDVRLYCRFDPNAPPGGENQDIKEWLKLWEDFKYDPTFNLLVTKDNARFAGQKAVTTRKVKKERLVDCPVYRKNGKVYNQKWEEYEVEEKVDFDVLRYNPDYLDPKLAKLQEILYSEAPIVQDRYFSARALRTVKNKGVYSVVWGGCYYEFRGIKRSTKKGATDEDLFFNLFGVGNARALFDRLQSDQRAAIFRSGVTGKPRRVDVFQTPAGREGSGLASVTHDLLDQDIDTGTHPIMNLLNFKDAAREDIFEGPNGMHAYAIFDGNGKLLDEADINAVSDRTVPSPHPPKLEGCLSCMACHEAEGSDGWRDVRNDARTLLGGRKDPLTGRMLPTLDLIADTHAKDQVGAINRIAGLYVGDFTKKLRRGRDDYAEAVLKASGPQGVPGDDLTDIVKKGVGRLVSRTRGYIYDQVSAKQALRESGVPVEQGDDPVDTLAALLPPEPAALGGFLPEDPRVGALKAGLAIPRTDWSFIQSFVASRLHKRNKK